MQPMVHMYKFYFIQTVKASAQRIATFTAKKGFRDQSIEILSTRTSMYVCAGPTNHLGKKTL
jgi:hypothetical protein